LLWALELPMITGASAAGSGSPGLVSRETIR
jgi:hypothetical protein